MGAVPLKIVPRLLGKHTKQEGFLKKKRLVTQFKLEFDQKTHSYVIFSCFSMHIAFANIFQSNEQNFGFSTSPTFDRGHTCSLKCPGV